MLPTNLEGFAFVDFTSQIRSKQDCALDDNGMQNTQGVTALLVEDSAMIAMDIEQILLDHGIGHVRLAATLEDADHHLTDTIDVAVLDFSLGEETTEPLALRMLELGIPFIFVSGFAEKVGLKERLQDTPIVTKPFQPDDLMAAINVVLFRKQQEFMEPL